MDFYFHDMNVSIAVASGKVLEKGTLVLTLHSLETPFSHAQKDNFPSTSAISHRIANLYTEFRQNISTII